MRNLLANLKRFIDSLDSGMYDVMFASFSTIIEVFKKPEEEHIAFARKKSGHVSPILPVLQQWPGEVPRDLYIQYLYT